MESTCEYCNSAKSLLIGNVYCSRHSTPMRKLDNGTILIQSKEIDSVEHTSRLSIRYNFSGEQHYQVGSNHHLIRPDRYLVINQNQTYKTAVQDKKEQDIFIIAFKPDFAEQLLYNLITPADKLLDDPENIHAQPVRFFEQTYQMQPELLHVLKLLRQNMDKPDAHLLDLEHLYGSMLEMLLQSHRNINRQVESMQPVKKSTRIELYRRISLARDYLAAFSCGKTSVTDAASAAALSPYHFMRLFRQVYRQTPHQFLTEQRLQKAVSLLLCTNKSVTEICNDVGFEDSSSFGKLFRKNFGLPPQAYRQRMQ